MKRIGGLKQQVGAGIARERTPDGRTPQEQISECAGARRKLETRKRDASSLGLYATGCRSTDIVLTELRRPRHEAEQQQLREHFLENIYPLVTPQATDPAHPFPFISNLSLNLLVTLRYPGERQPAPLARVKVPVGSGVPRFMKLEDSEHVRAARDRSWPATSISSSPAWRSSRSRGLPRDAQREHRDGRGARRRPAGMIETELRERKFAPIVRLEVSPRHESHCTAACWPPSSAWTRSSGRVRGRTACSACAT